MKKTDSIKSKLKKLQEDFGKEKVETIGVLDLREWENRIIKLQGENSRLIDEARYDVDVDNDELRALFKESDALWEEMSHALETITTVLEDKENQIADLDAEIAKQKAIINMYLRKREIYVDMTVEDNQMVRNEEIGPELAKLCNAELEAELKKIDKIEELIQRHKEVCYGYNAIISALRNGGEVKKAKSTKVKEEPEVEEAQTEAPVVEKKEDVDAAFVNGVSGELLDKAFANGGDKYVGLTGTEEPAEEKHELGEDEDIAQINIPHFEDQVEAKEEVMPLVMDATVGEEHTEALEEAVAVVQTEPAEEVEEVFEETDSDTLVDEASAAEATVESQPEAVEAEETIVAEPQPKAVEAASAVAAEQQPAAETPASIQNTETVVLDNPGAVASTVEASVPAAEVAPATVVLDTPTPAAEATPVVAEVQPAANEAATEMIDWTTFFENFENEKEQEQGPELLRAA